jgi:hypothetical protein
MPDPILANDPTARDTTGTLVDNTQPLTSQTSSETPTQTQETSAEPAVAAPAVPPEYTDFTLPEGAAVDAAALDSAKAVFKELGLTQVQAQKLVEFQATRDKSNNETIANAIATQRQQWLEQVNKDPELGPKIDAVKQEIGKAYTHLPPDVVKEFRSAMDFTGAGDNPAFIKAFYGFAKLVNEGKHITGGGPSAEGQAAPGKDTKPSLAAAMYPNLSR